MPLVTRYVWRNTVKSLRNPVNRTYRIETSTSGEREARSQPEKLEELVVRRTTQSGQMTRCNTRVIDNTDIVREAMFPTVTVEFSYGEKAKPPK